MSILRLVFYWVVGIAHFGRYKYLYIMTIIGVLLVFIFRYLPLYGVTIAFKQFSFSRGISGSKWIGFDNFINIFQNPYFFRIIRNTFLLGIMNTIWNFWPPILFALLLNEIRNRHFKKIVQTISYMPYFIAIVIIVGIMKDLFGNTGAINQTIESFGGQKIGFLIEAEWFRPLFIGSDIWQHLGYSSIIYLAVIASIDPCLYESSAVEGAGRFKQALYITIPCMTPTIIIMLIMATTNFVTVGFEKVYLMYSPTTYETADVLSTYIYRVGLKGGQMGLGAAVGLFESAIRILFITTSNYLARKFSDYSMW